MSDFLQSPMSDLKFGTNRQLRGWLVLESRYAEIVQRNSKTHMSFGIRLIPQGLFTFLCTHNVPPVSRGVVSTPLCTAAESSNLLDIQSLHGLTSYQRLYPYQKDGVEFVLRRGGRAMIADDMGLGKTFQAITLIHYLSVRVSTMKRVLVIVPASLRVNWIRECRELMGTASTPVSSTHFALLNKYSDVSHLPLTKLAQHYRELQRKAKNDKRKTKSKSQQRTDTVAEHKGLLVTVVSYSLFASKKMEAFRKLYHPHMVVCDESHYIKSSDSIRCKSVFRMVRDMYQRWGVTQSYVVLLTGTPSSISKDMYTQLRMLEPGLFRKFARYFKTVRQDGTENGALFFGERYCEPEEVHLYGGRKTRVFKGTARAWELNTLIRRLCIRRIKMDVLRDLPDLCRYRVSIDRLSPSKTRYFQQQMKHIEALRENEGKRRAESAMTQLVLETSTLKQKSVCGFLKQYIQTMMLPSDKCLIFAHHIAMIDAIREMVTPLSIGFIHIDGRTPHPERQKLVDQFQQESKTRLAILGITAAGTGLNLYAANVVFFAELTWNQKLALQAECRSHRIGQTQNVLVKYLLLEGSTDETMWLTLNKKIKNTAAILDNHDERLNAERVAFCTDESKCVEHTMTSFITPSSTRVANPVATQTNLHPTQSSPSKTHKSNPNRKRMQSQMQYIQKRRKQ